MTVPAESPATSLIWMVTFPNMYLDFDENPAPEIHFKVKHCREIEEKGKKKKAKNGVYFFYQSNCQV